MLRVEEISKKFWEKDKGEFYAVEKNSFEINKGEVFGLLGPNGAGKTTLLRMLINTLEPSSGGVFIEGRSLKDNLDEFKKRISFLSENTKLYEKLSPNELLDYFGELYEIDKKTISERKTDLFEKLAMNEFKDKQIGKLSTGQKQKTSLARTMINDADIYILDEPTLGLDIITSKAIIEFIKEKSREGKTIVFSTHYMEEAEYLCDRIALFHKGKILDIDTLSNYKNKGRGDNLREIFLSYINEVEEGKNEKNL